MLKNITKRRRRSLLEVSVDGSGKIRLVDTGLLVEGKPIGNPYKIWSYIHPLCCGQHPVTNFHDLLIDRGKSNPIPRSANAYSLGEPEKDDILNEEMIEAHVQFYRLTDESILKAFGIKMKR